MLRASLHRIALAVPALFGVSVLVFLLMNVLPGDPAASFVRQDATVEERELIREELGLNDPLPVRYVTWVSDAATGDLGYSLQRRRDVSSLIEQAWWNTAILAAFSAGFGLVLGVGLGALAAIKRGRWPDRVISTVILAGLSVPSFWVAILLLILFSSQLQLLPTSGTGLEGGPIEFFRHLIMPVVSGSLVTVAITARVTRASMVETFEADFVSTLRAKGLRSHQILWHVMKNAMGPVLTTSGLQIGYLLGGSVLIETIFRWPGMGTLVFNAISARDLLVVQGATLVIATSFVVINLIVDIVQSIVNPSLQRAMA